MYGKLRRSDFLPAGEEKPDEVLERGYYSLDSEDDEGCGLEYAFQTNAFDDLVEGEDEGRASNDFLEKGNDLEPAFEDPVSTESVEEKKSQQSAKRRKTKYCNETTYRKMKAQMLA